MPGPKSLNDLKKIDQLTEGRHAYFIIDYENSKGNFLKDID